MLYFTYENDQLVKVSSEPSRTALTRNDIISFPHAIQIAGAAWLLTGRLHLACDNGRNVYPRYDVIEAPKVGDKVSRTINGDYYPEGEIVHVSASKKVVRTSTGLRFDRKGTTASWRNKGTWTLVAGHINERNPHV